MDAIRFVFWEAVKVLGLVFLGLVSSKAVAALTGCKDWIKPALYALILALAGLGAWFAGNEAFANDSAYKNGTLQVAYLILALRAVGLDTGPMTGFDNAKVDAEFFPDGQYKSNVLINIGYGDASKLFPRSPRFSFDQIAKII